MHRLSFSAKAGKLHICPKNEIYCGYKYAECIFSIWAHILQIVRSLISLDEGSTTRQQLSKLFLINVWTTIWYRFVWLTNLSRNYSRTQHPMYTFFFYHQIRALTKFAISAIKIRALIKVALLLKAPYLHVDVIH